MEVFYDRPSDVFPTTIITERLRFERLSYAAIGVTELYELYSSLTHETRFVRFTPYESRIEAKEFLRSSMEDFDAGNSAGYAMFVRDDVDIEGLNVDSKTFIGTAGFEPDWDASIAESGIFLLEEFWGYGFSTERGLSMVELAFEEYDFEYWISRCHPDNEGSKGAIENYVVGSGGRLVGRLPNQVQYEPGEYDDTLVFVLSCESYFDES